MKQKLFTILVSTIVLLSCNKDKFYPNFNDIEMNKNYQSSQFWRYDSINECSLIVILDGAPVSESEIDVSEEPDEGYEVITIVK